MSVNKVILVGNVGKDPETRYLDEGTAMTKFSLATSESYKNKSGERITTTEWHNVVLWRGLAQVAEKYVRKGTQLYIEGRIKTRSYDDSDGNKKYITEIVGDQMQLLGRKPDDSGEQGQDSHRESGGASQAISKNTGGSSQSTYRDSGTGSGKGTTTGANNNEPDPFSSGEEGPDDLPF
ncbi:MAG: single-stranded DNA-binding protein [Bacteroidetes bacterium]|nr:MAG: single-stranded DNA-binding protein [Bacteroidota bacterium]